MSRFPHDAQHTSSHTAFYKAHLLHLVPFDGVRNDTKQGEPTRPIDAEHHEISGVFVGANQSGAVSINTNLRRARQSVLPSRNLENGVRHGRVDEIHVMTNLDRVEDTLLRNRTQNVEEL